MNGMTLIVKTITRLVLGFTVIFAANIIIYGHITPGGGFAGGVILACAFILLVLAFGKKGAFDIVSEKTLSGWASLAALGIIEIFFIGLYSVVFFKKYFPHGDSLRLISGGTIMWSNINVGIKVSVFLFAVFIAMALFRFSKEH